MASSTLKEKIMESLFYIMRVFPIQKNKIVVTSYFGQGYGDNAKYIIEELLKNEEELDIVWLVNNLNAVFPKGVRAVRFMSPESVYEMVTAGIWINNSRQLAFVKKRKGQFYIQTWHAGIAFKRVEKDVESALPPRYVDAAKEDSKMADLFLSDSKWTTNLYRRSFWYDGKIAEFGLPRQDVLFRSDEEIMKRIRKSIGIKDNAQILLYAPTFRKNNLGNESYDSMKVYDLGWENVLKELQDKYGGEWIGLIRLHPNIANLKNKLILPDAVLDVTAYPDMQELLMVSDCLITDYSSCVFDFGMTGKKAFLYALDMEEYQKDRDLYFKLEELPFSLAQSPEELSNNIRNFDQAEYRNKLNAFFNDECGVYEGGHASESTAKIILKRIKGRK